MGKICTIQNMLSHVRIDGNEAADKLSKEARDLNSNTTYLVALNDPNATAFTDIKRKLSEWIRKFERLVRTEKLKRQLLD